MGSVFGKNIKLSIFGESHGASVGMVLDGFPAGIEVDEIAIRRELDRRKPGQNPWSTARKEGDLPQILSGIYQGRTTGTPIAVYFKNNDTRSQDYANIETHYRPSHADFTGMIRYDGFNDPRGGGHFSGRLTTGMVYAGALAKQLLSKWNVTIKGHLSAVGEVEDIPYEEALFADFKLQNDFPMYSEKSAKEAKELIERARKDLDSVGAKATLIAENMPLGIGNPIFDNIESQVSSALFAVPGIKGVAFGTGFDLVRMKGSEANDCLVMDNETVKTQSNHSGGINGGISNGMPIIVHVAVKPTASIGRQQETLKGDGKMGLLQIKGRHDPCIGPRALVVLEAMFAISLLDLILDANGYEKIKNMNK